MRFAYVKDAGFVVMSDGEELDSWSVIINGCVQIEFPDGEIDELHVGQRSVLLCARSQAKSDISPFECVR